MVSPSALAASARAKPHRSSAKRHKPPVKRHKPLVKRHPAPIKPHVEESSDSWNEISALSPEQKLSARVSPLLDMKPELWTKPLASDPLQAFMPPPASAGSVDRLAYCSYLGAEGFRDPQAFLSVYQSGANISPANSAVVYDVPHSARIFDPQFSPDGNYVLFKRGDPYEIAPYLAYCLNLKTGQFDVGVDGDEGVADERIMWAPDSQHIAYIRYGLQARHSSPPELWIHNFSTRTSHRVAMAPNNMIRWTPQNTLLFALPPAALTREKSLPQRPSIYEVAADGGAPQLLIADALDPLPSPDGRWVMCHAWITAQEKKERAARRAGLLQPGAKAEQDQSDAQAHLYLYDRAARHRFALPDLLNLWDEQWTPDSQRIIILFEHYEYAAPCGTATISTLDVPALVDSVLLPHEHVGGEVQPQVLATLHFKDYEPRPGQGAHPHVQVLRVAPDSSTIFAQVIETTGQPLYNGAEANTLTSVEAVNLKSGAVTTVAQIKNAVGNVDWLSGAATTTPVATKP